MILVSTIQEVVCERHNLPRGIMKQQSPKGILTPETTPIVHARQEAMFLAVRLTHHSISRVAHFFGLTNHTSVMAAIRRVEDRMSEDLVARAFIEEMIEKFEEAA